MYAVDFNRYISYIKFVIHIPIYLTALTTLFQWLNHVALNLTGDDLSRLAQRLIAYHPVSHAPYVTSQPTQDSYHTVRCSQPL